MGNSAHIGRVIRTIREGQGRTIADLADAADVDRGNLSRFERGLEGMGPENIKRIANAMGYRVWQMYLLAEEESAQQLRAWIDLGESLEPDQRAAAIRLFGHKVDKQAEGGNQQ